MRVHEYFIYVHNEISTNNTLDLLWYVPRIPYINSFRIDLTGQRQRNPVEDLDKVCREESLPAMGHTRIYLVQVPTCNVERLMYWAVR